MKSKVVRYADEEVTITDVLLALGIAAMCVYFSGCGYALVKVPGPGERVYLGSEQRINSTFETSLDAVDSAASLADPLSYYRKARQH